MNNYLSINVKRYRESKGLTQRQLADMMGVSPQAVSKWENGFAYPDILLLPDLTAIMRVTIDDLISTTLEFE